VSATFWDGIGERLAERWASVSIPALTFWLGGLFAWMLGHHGTDALEPAAAWIGRHSAVVQAAVLLAGLLAVAATGLVVGRLTAPALALLEGYWWPWPLQPLRRRLTKRVAKRAVDAGDCFQILVGPVLGGTATGEQREEFARVDHMLRRLPTGSRLMPTSTGNTLRAAETRPIDKYGLDAVALWPHLWLLLPDVTRSELAAARRSLDTAVGACIWGVLFTAFTPLTWWALPLGLAVAAAAAWVWVPARAEVFADLVEAAFDLHRGALYRQLRWPLPANPAEERASGRLLTQYLVRGLSGTTPSFSNGALGAAAEPGSPAP
jgi:hypothetical protein